MSSLDVGNATLTTVTEEQTVLEDDLNISVEMENPGTGEPRTGKDSEKDKGVPTGVPPKVPATINNVTDSGVGGSGMSGANRFSGGATPRPPDNQNGQPFYSTASGYNPATQFMLGQLANQFGNQFGSQFGNQFGNQSGQFGNQSGQFSNLSGQFSNQNGQFCMNPGSIPSLGTGYNQMFLPNLNSTANLGASQFLGQQLPTSQTSGHSSFGASQASGPPGPGQPPVDQQAPGHRQPGEYIHVRHNEYIKPPEFGFITQLGMEELECRQNVTGLVLLYTQAIHWFVSVGLLPEQIDSQASPFPAKQLLAQRRQRREQPGLLVDILCWRRVEECV